MTDRYLDNLVRSLAQNYFGDLRQEKGPLVSRLREAAAGLDDSIWMLLNHIADEVEGEQRDLRAMRDRLLATIGGLQSQVNEMRAVLVHIEPRCEYVGCDLPGPHCTHTVSGVGAAKEANHG
jgi:hypothetical protein